MTKKNNKGCNEQNNMIIIEYRNSCLLFSGLYKEI